MSTFPPANDVTSGIIPEIKPEGCVLMEPSKERTCEVCGAVTPTPHVCSSGYGPVSFNYCTTCLNKGAEPLSIIQYLVEDVVDFSPALNDLLTYKDGEYITLEEYKLWYEQQEKS